MRDQLLDVCFVGDIHERRDQAGRLSKVVLCAD